MKHLGANLALLALALATASPRGFAQQTPCLDRMIAVNVTTLDGTPAKGLTAVNFRAKVRGGAADVVSATYDTGPRRVVFLLDTSASMFEGNTNKWRPTLLVAEDLVSTAPSQVSFALVTFASKAENRVSFGQDRRALLDELQKLEGISQRDIKGGHLTALRDAMLEALSLLSPARTGDAIYVVTDTGENASRRKESQVRPQFLWSGVRLFGFVPAAPTEPPLPSEPYDGLNLLDDLVASTGGDGIVLYPPSEGSADSRAGEKSFGTGGPFLPKSGVPPTVRDILLFASRGLGQEISEFYRVNIRLHEPVLGKPRDWKLEVIATATGKKIPHLRLVYPRKLAPCP
ncbi:MAG TPA: vWA domain-containing protein [Terriglobia bacterium]|nr:vWA domain-containing protein [Terriglobia bacterium]